jgi:hypothetical protein
MEDEEMENEYRLALIVLVAKKGIVALASRRLSSLTWNNTALDDACTKEKNERNRPSAAAPQLLFLGSAVFGCCVVRRCCPYAKHDSVANKRGEEKRTGEKEAFFPSLVNQIPMRRPTDHLRIVRT